MVVVDHGLTKGVIFIPTNKELTALEAAELHFDHTFKELNNESVPRTILRPMEKQNELIENSKPISEYSAREFQKTGIKTSLLPNSHSTDDPILLRNEPRSTSC
jgi:hypothetical protein